MQKLAIYSYFWVNYSIYLQKSSLSNILPVGYMIRYNILPPVNDLTISMRPPATPHDPLPKIWGSQPPSVDASECGQLQTGKGNDPCGHQQANISTLIIPVCFADIRYG